MSTTVVCQEFTTASIVHDQGSASGKSIVWPKSATAVTAYNEGVATTAIVHDESSASGMSIVWPGSKLEKIIQEAEAQKLVSVASTRANSPAASSSTDDGDDAQKQASELQAQLAEERRKHQEEVMQLHEEIKRLRDSQSAPLNAAGTSSAMVETSVLDLKDLKNLSIGLDYNKAASPATTAAGSPYASSLASTPSTWRGGISPMGDASQRTPTSASPLCIPRLPDASQRIPPHIVRQHLNSKCLQVGDASQRTPPQRLAQHLVGALSAKPCADASQRSLTSSYPQGCGSWDRATAAVAATRAAADAGSENTAMSAGTQHLGTDSLKHWLAGITETSALSSQELAERLQAAAPETYDD